MIHDTLNTRNSTNVYTASDFNKIFGYLMLVLFILIVMFLIYKTYFNKIVEETVPEQSNQILINSTNNNDVSSILTLVNN